MTMVFINYRGSDSAWAVMLDRELTRQFGPDRVFQASRSIPAGADFTEWIMDHLRRSSVLLAIIGPDWYAATDRSGRRRLLEEEDWVRREIAAAFTLGIPVIPVLVDKAPRLDSTELPTEIARLARCQYLRLHYRNAVYDVARLIDELVKLVPGLHPLTETSGSGSPTPDRAATKRAGPAEGSPTVPATPGRRHTLAWSFIALVILLVAVLTTTSLGKWNTSPSATPDVTTETSPTSPTSPRTTLSSASPVAPPVAPSSVSTITSSLLPDDILTQGTLRMKQSDRADLENGRVGAYVSQFDLSLLCFGRGQCIFQGPAKVAALPTTARPGSKPTCATALNAPFDPTASLGSLSPQEILCVQTQESHFWYPSDSESPRGGDRRTEFPRGRDW